jgi:hypothetical protein
MNKELVRTKGNDFGMTKERAVNVGKIMALAEEYLPPDAIRIEIDIEYADGGRVKMEGRA